MTLKQLEAFYWAATCSHFAIAAQRLNISVSSLSKRIAELETSLGKILFERSARSACLTPLGENLVLHAKNLLRQTEQFRHLANEHSALAGRCRFGVGELISLTWLPDLLTELQHAHPQLLLEPTVNLGQALELRLENGELDFAIVAGTSTRTAIASHKLGSAAFTWVAAHDLPDASGLAPEHLARLTLVSLPPGAGTVRLLDAWQAEHGAIPGRHLYCENWGSVAGLIQRGLGIGFLPAAWAEILVERGQMQFLPSLPPLASLHYSFQWRRDDSRPLIEYLRDIALSCVDFHAPTCLL